MPYLKLLKGLAEIYPADAAPATGASLAAAADPNPAAAVPPAFAAAPETLRGPDGRAIEGDPGPCIRCGVETTYQSTDGRPLRSGAMCQPADPATTPAAPTPSAQAAAPARPAHVSPAPSPVPSRPERRARSAARAQADTTALIARAVQEEAERAGGDEEEALKALIKRAIPDVMHLFNETRATARYDYTAYPALPDILKKPSKKDPDQIWEARPKFHHPGYSLRAPGDVKVTALDVNAAYLSALKCWLPIGKLEHSTGMDGVDPKRSGVHLITPGVGPPASA